MTNGLRRGLYLITPDCLSVDALMASVAPVLEFASVVQLRSKSADEAVRHAQAVWLREHSREQGVPLIINDDVALAKACHADGVHLGQQDGSIEAARAVLGSCAIIGASCYDHFELAQAATRAGADYVAFGAVFSSSTKPLAVRAPMALFGRARDAGMQSVAIGGITPETIGEVVAAGADLAAVISGIYAAPDPRTAAAHCARAFL